MSQARFARSDCGVKPRNTGALAAATHGLALAGSPTFACMALLTASLGNSPAELLCSAAHASPLGGMGTMYLLMSVLHLAPWLKLISRLKVEPGMVLDVSGETVAK